MGFVLTAVLTARHRHGLTQDCLFRHQSLDLIDEDHWRAWFVQIFLGKNVCGEDCLRGMRKGYATCKRTGRLNL